MLVQLRKSEIEYYCMLAKVMVVPYNGNNTDMGTAVGQFFRVSAMTILDPGAYPKQVLSLCLPGSWPWLSWGGRAGASSAGGCRRRGGRARGARDSKEVQGSGRRAGLFAAAALVSLPSESDDERRSGPHLVKGSISVWKTQEHA